MITNNPANILTWKELSNVNYNFDFPFQLELEGKKILYVDKIVRLIPKRRIVVFANWQGKLVVAKLFIDTPHAKRHLAKELRGLQALEKNKIPTPKVEFSGTTSDQRIQVLILERIMHANSFGQLWQSKTDVNELMPQLKNITIELATQHVLGIVQKDLHLNNFLVTENQIYTLDGAEILVTAPLLPKKNSMQHLAIFLSQLGVGTEKYQKELFLYYAKSRGWLLKKTDLTCLFELIKQHDQYRWQRYREKIFRNCTEFANVKSRISFCMANRHYMSEPFKKFLQQPDAAFKKPEAILKAGNSATVIKANIGGREFVIKRYNMKSIFHWLRRAFRPTRAATSWILANKLQLFGIATAKPVAFIETRQFGLRGVSYYVTEYIHGLHAAERLQKTNYIWPIVIVDRISNMIKNLLHLNVSHGDLKITNILITENETPILIDLDGAQEHRSRLRLQRKWQKDVKRFLRNFMAQPNLAAEFSTRLSRPNQR